MNEEFEKWFKQEMELGNLIAYQDAKEGFEAAEENMQAKLDAKDKELETLREEIEDERIRLSACGVVALANTTESAKEQRQMLDKYKSASLEFVVQAVDREMKYRTEIEDLRRFAMHAYICVTAVGDMLSIESFKHFGLIDENGSPTPLLTGDK